MPCEDHNATIASIIRGIIHGDLLSLPLVPAGSAPVVNSALSWTPNGSDILCVWYIVSTAGKAHLKIIICFKVSERKGTFFKEQHFNLKNLELKFGWRRHNEEGKNINTYWLPQMSTPCKLSQAWQY